MEDFSQYIEFISSVGFPVLMCLLFFWYFQTIGKQTLETLVTIKENINEMNTQLRTLNKCVVKGE